MSQTIRLPEPKFIPPLDPAFRPAVLSKLAFLRQVRASGRAVPLRIALNRPDRSVSLFETEVYADGHPRSAANRAYAERILKFLLWQRGGWQVHVGGPPGLGKYLGQVYSSAGERSFDARFLGERIYRKPFTVISCNADDVPPELERSRALGRHLDGCRIGFDLGASDIKVSAVIDGQAVYSQEIVWEPTIQADPHYHYGHITSALKIAMSKMPRLDAIGGSSAGVYVDNRPMVASLFRGIPPERYGEVRDMFLRIGDEFGVPLEVINDGEVTALAGSMSLQANSILGIAMGSSQAAGYVDAHGSITGWLNELSFAPVDYGPHAPVEEWSGDKGVGARYFSQQCVFRLAPQVGIELPTGVTRAEKLRAVQEKLEAGHPGARQVWQTMGIYLGYAVAHYAGFYDLEHILILGRCTSGSGGPLILNGAQEVLAAEFPELAAQISIQLPDEKSRRVGQSIAAASLPALR